jgi:hypothetical protein
MVALPGSSGGTLLDPRLSPLSLRRFRSPVIRLRRSDPGKLMQQFAGVMLGDPQTCLVELVGNAGVERDAGLVAVTGIDVAKRFAASATSSSRSVILIRGIRSYAACANGPASGGSSAFSGVIFRVRS